MNLLWRIWNSYPPDYDVSVFTQKGVHHRGLPGPVGYYNAYRTNPFFHICFPKQLLAHKSAQYIAMKYPENL